MAFKEFFGKILLFGEYTVLRGGTALTVPYPSVSGRLDYFCSVPSSQELWSNQELHKFLAYLRNLKTFDLLLFEKDINSGLFFNSSIPAGYGAGSSGALVAAIFDRYCDLKHDLKKDLNRLRWYLAQMESYFHGNSSGIDPLSCYIGKSLIIKNNTIEIQDLSSESYSRLFLINTAQTSSTVAMIKLYNKKCTDGNFCRMVDDELSTANSMSIKGLVSGNDDLLYKGFGIISQIQFRYFREMIPKNVMPLWKKGIDNGEYYLKLCGSGGGGFVIGIAGNTENTVFSKFEI